MAHIRVGDEHFNVAVEGPPDAPIIMLSNSLGANYRMWDPQMPELTQHFQVIRYDSRGHGASPADEGPYSIEQLGRDALAILDKLGVDKAHFVGLSKGGMVGQWLMVNAPERIDRAVLANTGAHMGGAEVWNARIRAAREQGMHALGAGTMERWFSKEFREEHPETVAIIQAMVEDTPAHGYAACCAAIRDMDQREAIRAIRHPVLVIVGRHDAAALPSMGHSIAESIPGARVVSLNAAHLSNVEQPDAFTKAVLEFLMADAAALAPAAKTKRAKKTAARKSPAKKAAAKKAPAKKAAGKKAAGKKAAGKKTSVKKAAGKKSPAKKAAGKKTAKKSAAKKTSAKKSTRKSAGKTKSAAKKSPTKSATKRKKSR